MSPCFSEPKTRATRPPRLTPGRRAAPDREAGPQAARACDRSRVPVPRPACSRRQLRPESPIRWHFQSSSGAPTAERASRQCGRVGRRRPIGGEGRSWPWRGAAAPILSGLRGRNQHHVKPVALGFIKQETIVERNGCARAGRSLIASALHWGNPRESSGFRRGGWEPSPRHQLLQARCPRGFPACS